VAEAAAQHNSAAKLSTFKKSAANTEFATLNPRQIQKETSK
jgi:hypothetical protein